MNVTNWNPYEAFTQLFIGRKGAVRVAFFLQELIIYAPRRRNCLTLRDISYGFYRPSQALFLEIASLQPAYRQ